MMENWVSYLRVKNNENSLSFVYFQTANEGGIIVLNRFGRRESYIGSTQFEITTHNYGSWDHSYNFTRYEDWE